MTSSSPPPHLSSDFMDPPLGVPLLLPPPPPPPPPQPPSSRRLPPPCWTPDETSALIDAYREKWYSLRRGNLRAAHWQDVADDVHRRCPHVVLPKTAVQCRHKMEKLRKRYRTELQRAKSIPHHRFSSSWVYFYKMDSMEKGDDAASSSLILADVNNNNDNNSVSTVVVAANHHNDAVNHGFDDVDDDVDGDGDDGGDCDDVDDEDYSVGGSFKRNGLRIRIAGNSRKSYAGFDENPNPNPNSNSNYNPNCNIKFRRQMMLRCNNEFATPPKYEEGGRYRNGVLRNGSNGGGGSTSGMGLGMGMSVMAKKKRSVLGKREREMQRDGEKERDGERSGGDKATMAMVEAIRVLGEGFVRVEKMKMEMMRETERVRMENEMRRTEMILQSQQHIVEAFAKGWADLVVNNDDDDNDDKNNNKDASS
ncbi:hypothetical protein BVRB_9g218180 [Beta vulgaris subsp. vulgaris]|uniref:uncharacterized protein LOC104904423 n=1 Tax=Beta vulgaris subsp. vulgaris TaxID=3555 RepID=UPI00053FBE7D|nr:uncharacterized protein LOC104904423 [Beta vulgaris subsp. vulgaris]KMT00521.1 hypothetical protein BVRB_9g218180 [Beta vulgaris subsp. vulgaris]